MKKWIIMFMLLVAFPAYGATLLDTGWENAQNGCLFNNTYLFDGGNIPMYSDGGCCTSQCTGPMTCAAGNGGEAWSGPAIEVVSDRTHTGNHALRVNYMDNRNGACDDTGGNGPYACIAISLGSARNEMYIRYYTYWSPGFVFTDRIKQLIFYPTNLYLQLLDNHLYFETYSNGSAYSVTSGPGSGLVGGRWYLIEWHVKCGAGGFIKARVNGQDVVFNVHEGGPAVDVNNFNACGNPTNFKIDHTYNNWSGYVTRSTTHGYQWYDDLKITDAGGWIGPKDGSSAPDSISAPTNLRIVE